MIKVKLDNRYGRKWFTKGHWTCSGHVFWQEALLKQSKLAEWLADHDNDFPWPQSLQSTNGFFSIVRSDGESLLAAVDRIRSLPLFYGRKGGDLFLSDDPYWIREQLGPAGIDACSAVEFHTPGYVTGPDTLYADIKQLQAGECLTARQDQGGLTVDVRRYYRFYHHDYYDTDDMETLLKSHDEMILRVFDRLIETLDGRPVVVPLSGGYDSRLIATLLKRMGYKDVTCFSYGVPGNEEARISKEVSEKLGFPWLFCEYSNEKWRRWYESDERKAYDRFADELCNASHIQDWPAVWEFKRQGLLSDDSVFIPGHSGDFLAGSHIPKHLGFIRSGGLDQAVNAIQQVHYEARQFTKRFPRSTWEQTGRKVRRLLEEMPTASRSQAASACESWDWQERQAKKIVNSVRVYEFWGYSWRIPLWDAEMMDWWEHVPPLRDGTNLYDSYVLRQGEAMGLPRKDPKPLARKLRTLVKHVLEKVGGLRYARAALNRKEYERHPLAFYGMIPPERFHEVVDLPTPMLYYMAMNRMEEIQKMLSAKPSDGPRRASL